MNWFSRVFHYVRPVETKRHYWLLAIMGAAVCLRVMMALFLGDEVIELPGTYDQISYSTLALRVLTGHGFSFDSDWWPATPAGEPTAHWSYLYTLYLVVIYGLVGYHPLVARLLQAVLAGILMPWLVYRLGCRHFGIKVGLVAAGFMAFYAYFIYYAGALLTETFYIIAVLWSLDLAGQLGQGSVQPSNLNLQVSPPRRYTEGFILGVALSFGVLLRQLFLMFIPFLFAWLLWRSYRYQARSVGQMIRILAGATLILVLSIAPWTFRNYEAFHRFVLLNTNAGFAFFWGNHPIHGYNFISILPDDGPSYQDLIPPELINLNEAELDQALLKRGLAFIQVDPGRYLILSISRIKDYFKFWPSPDSGLISNISRVISFGLLGPFMIYGLVVSLRRSWSSEAQILYLFIVIYTVIHLMSWALIRYRLPIDAILLVFAGFAVMELKTKLSRAILKTHPAYTSTSFR